MGVSGENGRSLGGLGAGWSASRFALLMVIAVAAVSLLVSACGGSSTEGGGNDSGPEEQLSFNPNSTRAGQNVTVRGVDLPEVEQNTIVRAELVAVGDSGEVSLGNVNIVNGIFTISVFVPQEMEPGEYTVELRIRGDAQPEEPITAPLTIQES